ncbi:hypothetical protein FOA52_006701 [Chlamydomonas sp. UWO 241]|nr:hypothetical protein FOA52_006701 [Chlamydomonas sp. UWO 241]
MDQEASSSGGGGGVAKGNALQDSFLEWRRAKAKTKKAEAEAGPKPSPPDAARKQQLRQMFVELASSYLGVPYCRRAHDPGLCTCDGCTESGRQLHSDATFIDCCALVRVVVRRMREQLGIRLGPLNQAFQFDTLPVRVGSVAKLEAGDLIFYSGTYANPDTKQHPFDMTHVEVFTGCGSTGEGTIGSRERSKWVKEYDSYKFTSVRWSLISHFFCKLDPWLEGVCTPQHPELWREPWGNKPALHPESGQSWDAKKYSIFSGDGNDEDTEGQDAQDD